MNVDFEDIRLGTNSGKTGSLMFGVGIPVHGEEIYTLGRIDDRRADPARPLSSAADVPAAGPAEPVGSSTPLPSSETLASFNGQWVGGMGWNEEIAKDKLRNLRVDDRWERSDRDGLYRQWGPNQPMVRVLDNTWSMGGEWGGYDYQGRGRGRGGYGGGGYGGGRGPLPTNEYRLSRG